MANRSLREPFFILQEEDGESSSLSFNPSIILLNVQSVNTCKFNSLVLQAENVNFICLTETWCTSLSISSFHHDNFKPCVTVFLVGDFNIDSISRPREFRILCNELFTFGLTPRVNWPTRVTQQTVTVIDHIFSNCSDDAVACVLDNDISDNRTVLFDCGFKVATNSSQHNLPKRSFNTNSMKTFHDISNEARSDLYKASNINNAYTICHCTFCYYFEKHFPKYKARSRPKRKLDQQ
nr:unnamed protein product [Callosobruchus analis]